MGESICVGMRLDKAASKKVKIGQGKETETAMETEWTGLIIKYLGKKLGRKTNEIQTNIRMVDSGLKLSYLLDFGIPDAERITILLQELKSRDLIQNRLILIVIETDFVISTTTNIQNILRDFDNYYRFVDVSPDIKVPCSVSKDKTTKGVFEALDYILRNSKESVHQISPQRGLNFTSLFGILIGYPVIYWYNTELDREDNCLSMEPLRHYEVFGRIGEIEHSVYSFSVPARLEDLFGHIDQWFAALKSPATWKPLFDKLNMKVSTVSLPSVNL